MTNEEYDQIKNIIIRDAKDLKADDLLKLRNFLNYCLNQINGYTENAIRDEVFNRRLFMLEMHFLDFWFSDMEAKYNTHVQYKKFGFDVINVIKYENSDIYNKSCLNQERLEDLRVYEVIIYGKKLPKSKTKDYIEKLLNKYDLTLEYNFTDKQLCTLHENRTSFMKKLKKED